MFDKYEKLSLHLLGKKNTNVGISDISSSHGSLKITKKLSLNKTTIAHFGGEFMGPYVSVPKVGSCVIDCVNTNAITCDEGICEPSIIYTICKTCFCSNNAALCSANPMYTCKTA